MSGAAGARRAVAYIRSTEGAIGSIGSSLRASLEVVSSAAEPSRGILEGAPLRLVEAPESASRQRSAIEAWAARERVEIAAWHSDVGVSGATPIAERPGLVAAYRDLRDLGAGMLVAGSADRFAHDALVCWLIERAALTQGASVHTADGSRGPAPTNVAELEEDVPYTRGALDLARAYQRVTFRARVRAALAERKAKGQRAGNIPYGFRLAADGVHVVPDEVEGEVISVVRRLAGEGMSQRKIARHLEARGVTGRTGAPLRQTQIANILRSAS